MSLVAISMNVLLAVLLTAALIMGWRLNRRLKALRDSHEGFAQAVAELDAAARRAEQGLADLRAATDEAAETLGDRVAEARQLSGRLERQVREGPALHEAEAAERAAERRLGALLSGAHELRPPRPRADPEREISPIARPSRPLSKMARALEEDLFDTPPAETEGYLSRGRR
ncbi:MAG: DUF6468 domain-containing protein [Phenylobacterium sp.]|uniref:DUF6468 domain-containing protein n=1 Tax=Phenylobacterium sp. TaxID=1871053 RepID=UPI00271EE7B5|nr:DUF6468 domain-containing protein [Phenylobacterium sp.]MDO8902727.1 DUF6468 domain-containing protein [Phenylobacterium sp.]MDP2212987.1 DUF6468 domain-containing protein [Phenylobacterium sp.]